MNKIWSIIKSIGVIFLILSACFLLMFPVNFALKLFVFLYAILFRDSGSILIDWIENHNTLVNIISFILPGIYICFMGIDSMGPSDENNKIVQNSTSSHSKRFSNSERSSFSFIDGRGNYRRWGDDFIDADGNWCSWGSNYRDHEGNVCRWGSSFIDGRGSHRRWGDDFYDGAGNWVRFVE